MYSEDEYSSGEPVGDYTYEFHKDQPNKHPKRNKTLHQCLSLNWRERFIFLLERGASLMKKNRQGITVIERILYNSYHVALDAVINHSTWFTPQKIDQNGLMKLAVITNNNLFAEFLLMKGGSVYNICPNKRIYDWLPNHTANYLTKYMIRFECETIKKLHESDETSWLYKDYLCEDVFGIIMGYICA